MRDNGVAWKPLPLHHGWSDKKKSTPLMSTRNSIVLPGNMRALPFTKHTIHTCSLICVNLNNNSNSNSRINNKEHSKTRMSLLCLFLVPTPTSLSSIHNCQPSSWRRMDHRNRSCRCGPCRRQHKTTIQ